MSSPDQHDPAVPSSGVFRTAASPRAGRESRRGLAVLVTGVAGTGKSTVLAELSRRGHRTLDLGEEPGWRRGDVGPDGEPLSLVDEPRLRELLREPAPGLLFVGGMWPGQQLLHPGAEGPTFDVLALLSLPPDVLHARLAARPPGVFGHDPADRARVQHQVDGEELLLRSVAAAEIDTRIPVAHVADTLEDVAEDHR